MKVEFLEADMHYLHGTVQIIHGFKLPLPRGIGLRAHDTDEGILVLADGVDGYQLERNMVANTTDAEVNAHLLEVTLPANIGARDYVEGATVSARRVTRMQCEGPDVILTSGTGAINQNTAVGSQLSYKDGRLRVAQAGDEIVWALRRQLTPEDAANACRLEVARGANARV